MRRKHYSYLVIATLLLSFLTACSGTSGNVPSATAAQPAGVTKADAPPPLVNAFNNSDIDEHVTQTTPACWAPTSATISPGDSQLFVPPATGCSSGTLKANAGNVLNDECDLVWVGGEILIVNHGNTDCTWQVTGVGKGTWTYQLSSGARKR